MNYTYKLLPNIFSKIIWREFISPVGYFIIIIFFFDDLLHLQIIEIITLKASAQ